MHRTCPVLLFLLVFGFYSCLFAQSEQPEPPSHSTDVQQPQEESHIVLSKAESDDTEAKLITAIEVKGNKTISSNAVVSKMKSRIGSPYMENIASDDLKRLFLLGFFSDIKIDTENYKDGVKLIVTVEEKPIVEKISFSGIRRITMDKEKLKGLLSIKEKQYLDYPKLSEDVRTIKKMYEKIGYPRAVVDYKVDINTSTNKASVEFSAAEEAKVRIKDIAVEGNSAFTDRRILRLMKTKRAWILNSGTLKEDVLKEDIERIKSFYRRQGYTDVAADFEMRPHAKKKSLLYVAIKIQEGKRYLVGNITVRGNKDILTEEILQRLKECVPGKVFSQEALDEDTGNIKGLYFDRGYISCRVEQATSVNFYTGRVDIVYDVIENEIVYVDKIEIKGNIKTKDVVIRRELRIHPGDRFDGDKLKRSKDRLHNLGFFEEVSYDTQDTASSDKKDLLVEVKEAKTGAFSFGGGYSTVDEFVGFVEIEQKNFDWRNFPYFTGDGQNLRLRASTGTLSSGFELSFTEPWLFDYPISFGFDAYKRIHQREEDVGYGYDEDITGGDLRLGREISEYTRADLMYRYDRIEIADVTDSATDDLKKETGKNSISSMSASVRFDSRDNEFDTKKGDLISGSIECAGGPFGADKDFWKFYGLASHCLPMFRESALELRIRYGLADAYGGSERLPIYERFFVGGANTIRGYEERKIGPIDSVSKDPLGGESMLVGNIEYTYPLFSFLKAALFYDTGNAWEKLSDLGSGGFKSSFGLGARFKTPVGPIKLDYGIPLNKAPGEDDKSSGRFHFSVSHGF